MSVPSSLSGLIGEARRKLVRDERWKPGTSLDEVAYQQGIIKAIDWMAGRGNTEHKVRKIT